MCRCCPAVIGLGLSLLPVTLHGGDLTLVSRETQAVIITPDAWKGSPPNGKTAEDLLVRIVAKMTCQKLAVLREGKAPAAIGAPRIYLGRSTAVEAAFGKELDKLDIEGFIVRQWQGNLVLAGRTGSGDFDAVVDFLRVECGCEWYMPGEIGECIPRRSSLVVSVKDRTEEPHYKGRYCGIPTDTSRLDRGRKAPWYCASAVQGDDKWGFVYIHRIRRGGFNQGHNLYSLLPPSKYGKEHPEYYPWRDEKRQVPQSDAAKAGWQPCMTNAGVAQAIAEEIVRQFRANPEARSVSLGMNDGETYCLCPECSKLKLTGAEAAECGENARLYCTFVNRIATEVAKEFPERILMFPAYISVKRPPAGMKMHPMLMCEYSMTASYKYRNPEARKQLEEGLDFWLGTGMRVMLHDWVYGAFFAVPVAQYHNLGECYRRWYQHGARAVYYEAYPHWGLDGHKYPLLQAILWNVNTGVDAWLTKFYRDFFGNASAPMAEYDRLMEKTWWSQTSNPKWGNTPLQFDGFTEEVLEQARALLRKAQEMADTPLTYQRVEMYRQAFEGSAIFCTRNRLMQEANKALDANDLPVCLKSLAAIWEPNLDYYLYYESVLQHSPLPLNVVPGCTPTMSGPLMSQVQERHLDEVMAITMMKLAQKLSQEETASLAPADFTSAKVRAAVGRRLEEIWGDTPATALVGKDICAKVLKDIAGKVARVPCWKGPKPQLDGVLDEPFWQTAPPNSDFTKWNLRPPKYRTEFKLAYDSDNL